MSDRALALTLPPPPLNKKIPESGRNLNFLIRGGVYAICRYELLKAANGALYYNKSNYTWACFKKGGDAGKVLALYIYAL